MLNHVENGATTYNPEVWTYAEQESQLEATVVRLLSHHVRGSDVANSAAVVIDAGVYSPLFEPGNSDDQKALIGSLCDYHTAHARRDYDPFCTVPFERYPVEIMATVRILFTDDPNCILPTHELLSTNSLFDHAMRDFGPAADTTLKQVIDRSRNRFPFPEIPVRLSNTE